MCAVSRDGYFTSAQLRLGKGNVVAGTEFRSSIMQRRDGRVERIRG